MTPVIPTQHSEYLSKALYALTIDPAKDIFYYFAPFIGAWFSGYRPLMFDAAEEAMMPQQATQQIVTEITALAKAAGISRRVIPCVGLNHHFSNSGGPFSLSDPAILIPDQALFRRGDLPFFGSDPTYQGDTWHFSDNEIRFFLARELVQIRLNNPLLRIAMKIAVVTAIIAVFTVPMSAMAAHTVLISALVLYIVTERHFQQTSDLKAIRVLQQKGIDNPLQIATAALEKLRAQNLYFRERSRLARIYINSIGDNYLDILHPPLNRRVAKLKKFTFSRRPFES